MVLGPAIVDYRFGDPNATTLSIYAVLTSISVAGTVILISNAGLLRRSSINSSAGAGLVFALSATGVGLLRGQNVMDVVRAAPSLFLYVNGLAAMSALAAAGADARSVWRHIVVAIVLSIFVQLGAVFLGRTVNFNEVRFEVLSTSVPVVTGWAISLPFFGGVTLLSMAIVVLHICVIMLSVTRSEIVIAATPTLALLIATQGQILKRPGVIQRILVVIVVAVFATSAGSLMPGSPLQRWEKRVFDDRKAFGGVDITALTRAGEARFQLDRLQESTPGLLFGYGIAAPTAFDGATAVLVNEIIGSNGDFTETGIGHNNYVGVIFVGGILAGGWLLFTQAVGAFKALIVLSRLSSPKLFDCYGRLSGAVLSYMALLAYGALGPLMATRGCALMTGVSLGLVLWVYEATQALAHARPTGAVGTAP
jgi:hypothetical protein